MLGAAVAAPVFVVVAEIPRCARLDLELTAPADDAAGVDSSGLALPKLLVAARVAHTAGRPFRVGGLLSLRLVAGALAARGQFRAAGHRARAQARPRHDELDGRIGDRHSAIRDTSSGGTG
jgi:hypothetical protein